MSEDQLRKLLQDTLLIITATSKKNNRDYTMVAVRNDVRFNNIAIDLLKNLGVEEIDVREKVEA